MFKLTEIIDGYKLVKRINTYTGLVSKGTSQEKAFISNPGRMTELLVKDAPVYIRKTSNPKRKTPYDLFAIKPKQPIVCIDSRVPNWIFEDHLTNDKIKELKGYEIKKREYKIGNSRIDYLLENNKDGKCLVELKLCTLVENEKILFPDAVSKRSSKHLLDLISATKQGYRAIVYFIGLRGDPTSFGPNEKVDPKFKETFDQTLDSEVELYALKTEVKYGQKMLEFSDLEEIAVKP
ncbi:MAG: DNA/RNA nuclease SfsA [Promethearchaeota archaeon]